ASWPRTRQASIAAPTTRSRRRGRPDRPAPPPARRATCRRPARAPPPASTPTAAPRRTASSTARRRALAGTPPPPRPPTAPAPAGSGSSAVSVGTNVSGLQPHTRYHYRVVATNAAGVTRGRDRALTTLRNPRGFTASASPNPAPWGATTTITGRVSGQGIGGT